MLWFNIRFFVFVFEAACNGQPFLFSVVKQSGVIFIDTFIGSFFSLKKG